MPTATDAARVSDILTNAATELHRGGRPIVEPRDLIQAVYDAASTIRTPDPQEDTLTALTFLRDHLIATGALDDTAAELTVRTALGMWTSGLFTIEVIRAVRAAAEKARQP